MKKSYRKMKRKTRTLPLLLTFVRGAIGKQYVIKHYRYGVIKTKYPDMTNIVASPRQRSCRDLFKEAVAHAKKVYADPVQKAAWKKKVRKKHLAFNYIIKDYMLAEKKAAKKREIAGKYLLRSCFNQGMADDTMTVTAKPEPCPDQLWDGYLKGKENNELILKDKLDIINLAKEIAVL